MACVKVVRARHLQLAALLSSSSSVLAADIRNKGFAMYNQWVCTTY